jgi:MFS transporter, SP family, general alpha glucoside:H+ symporter
MPVSQLECLSCSSVTDPPSLLAVLFLYLAVQWLLPVIISVLLVFTPESPAFLLRKGNPEGARHAILHLYGNRTPDQLEHRLVLIQLALAAEEEEAHATGSTTYLDCFHGIDLKRTLTVVSVFTTMQFSGIALGSNTTYFLSQIPSLPFAAVFDLSLGFLGLSGEYSGSLLLLHRPYKLNLVLLQAIINLFGPVLMEKSGRRLLFVYGNGLQAAILLALGGLYYATSSAGAWALGILYNLGASLFHSRLHGSPRPPKSPLTLSCISNSYCHCAGKFESLL